VGTSAGSINSATLAAYADRVDIGVDEMVKVWSRVRSDQVFHTDPLSIGKTAWQWIRDLSFGGLLGGVRPKALLNTAPLRRTLGRIPLERVAGHIAANRLKALAVCATNYYTSNGVLFLQGVQSLPHWERARYEVETAEIALDHLLASSAIPIFFPAVEIGGRHFGDGCIRNTAPLSPAIQLGATKIVAVGVRESLSRVKLPSDAHRTNGKAKKPPSLATVAGVLLDAVMIDAIEVDIDHCTRINRSVVRLEGDFRPIDVLWLRPTTSFASLATQLENHIPWLIHYLLRGLGDDEATAELASYLLFDTTFCNRLIDQGVADVIAQEAEIRAFFARP
jgi:NTE family protein